VNKQNNVFIMEGPLQELHERIKKCRLCRLCELGATQAVPGDGTDKTEVMFIGEGPGREEDIQGKPFVGAAR
jgi:uracil-DNA glycosylase